MNHAAAMSRALELSRLGMDTGHGGPFGAVLVREGQIVGEGFNRVLSSFDPTAHGEAVAMRDATARLRSFDLHDCDLYAIGMPCPLCMHAIFWARIKRVFYVMTEDDAKLIGFNLKHYYDEFGSPGRPRSLELVQLPEFREQAKSLYEAWRDKKDRVNYTPHQEKA